MATIRQYFETDFSNTVRVHIKLPGFGEAGIEGAVFVDFSGFLSFVAFWIPGADQSFDYFSKIIESLEMGKTEVHLDGKITLPSVRLFPGSLRIRKEKQLGLEAQFFGDPRWISWKEVHASTRVFIYSETQLSESEISKLKEAADRVKIEMQFRSQGHAEKRSSAERPLAFICHDSRDKEEVARKVAVGLGRMMCPVWYDEFSLKVGDNLRDSIEAGLKNCRKCVLVLSENFFSNRGWTKREFDSVFTREILEEKRLVLPIWLGVSKEQVFAYSPSLLNVKGLDWTGLGEDEVCRQLHRVITEGIDGENRSTEPKSIP